jgi:hypothetical protein
MARSQLETRAIIYLAYHDTIIARVSIDFESVSGGAIGASCVVGAFLPYTGGRWGFWRYEPKPIWRVVVFILGILACGISIGRVLFP